MGRLYDQHGASLYRYALMLLADAAARRVAEEIIALQLRRDQEQAARSTPPMEEFQ